MIEVAIRPEAPVDHVGVDAIHGRAFGGNAKVLALLRRLRDEPAPLAPVSLVAESDGQPVGHVLLSAARLDAPRRIVDVFTLSPIAVDPPRQRQGVGGLLIRAALAEADEQGVPLVFLEGAPDYYVRYGFDRATSRGFRSPSLRIPDAAFQVYRLSAYAPWMAGSFVYPNVFWDLDAVGLRDAG